MASLPPALAQFWAVALGYVLQPPPDGFDSWPAYIESVGLPVDEVDTYSALVDPDGRGPRLFFQKVPEGKQAKNRTHLDLNAGAPDHDWAKVRRTSSCCVRGAARSWKSVRTR